PVRGPLDRAGLRRVHARRRRHRGRRGDPRHGAGGAGRAHAVLRAEGQTLAGGQGKMANVPPELRYTQEHEWAKKEGDRIRVGITAFAQEQLGDVVFVELPKVGAKVTQRQSFGVVESVK